MTSKRKENAITCSIKLAENKIIIAFAEEHYKRNLDFMAVIPEYGNIYDVTDIIYDNENEDNYSILVEKSKEFISTKKFDRISIASFGPIVTLHRDDSTGSYARIGNNQPQGIAGGIELEKEYGALLSDGVRRHVNFFVNTDVNCSVVGEFFDRLRAGQAPFDEIVEGFSNEEIDRKIDYINASTMLVYILIGSGIGGGFTWGGYRVRDRMHPEMGHIHVDLHPEDPIVPTCEFHSSCAEGLASDTAHVMRLMNTKNPLLSAKIRANYIAQLIQSITLTLAPTMIVLDQVTGTKREKEHLLKSVRAEFKSLIGPVGRRYPGYLEMDNVSGYIVAPMGSRTHIETGIAGSLYMATMSFQERAYRFKFA